MTDLIERPISVPPASSAAFMPVVDERTPPQDVPAEMCVLGGMMLSKDAIADVVEALQADDFYQPKHRTVFNAIVDLYGRGEPADAITVAGALADSGDLVRVGGAPYLHTLVNAVPMAAHAAYYARIVSERAVMRRLGEAGLRIVQMSFAPPGVSDSDDVVERAQQAVYDVTARRQGNDFQTIGELFQSTLDQVEASGANGGVMQGIPTGFSDLDQLLQGLHPGQLVLVAGRPSLGKSTVAVDFLRAASIRHAFAAAVFSLEMSKIELVMRILSAEARVPLHLLRSGKLSDDDWAKLAKRMGEISEAPMFVDDTPNMTLMEIRSKARRLKERHDLKLVVVDYLQLMSSPKRVENRQQEVSDLSRGLKLLAREIEVPVVAVCQLNRGPEQRQDKRPILSDLRESGCMTGDTALLRADTGAPVTFTDLLTHGHEGVLLWSLDEERRLVAAPVTNVFASGVKDVYRLRLRSGREVKASGNHQFLTFNGWTRLDKLAAGGRVAVPRRVATPVSAGLGWSEHRLGLLAHLIGDGCVIRRQPVHYTSEDEANLAFVENAATVEFGITPRRVKQGNWTHVYLPNPQRSARGRRNPLHVWLADLGIENLRSYEKRLPDLLYQADDTEVALFLRHLWATDGRVAEPSSMTSGIPAVSYASTSRTLVEGVALLLGRLGIVSRLTTVNEKLSHRPGYRLLIQSGPDQRRFCELVGVHGARGQRAERLLAELSGRPVNTNVDTLPLEIWDLVKAERLRAGLTERQLQAAIGTHYCGTTLYKSCPSRGRLARCADALDSNVLRAAATDDVFWDQIVAVEPLGPLPVYDATVKGTHNFIADGVVAHNSLEQDADVVILLHRDDYYDKESPRAGEADFIVAKQRNGPTDTITVAAQLHLSRFVDMAVA